MLSFVINNICIHLLNFDIMAFSLPALPYAADALEPHID
ncbi:MAG: hypothetical protein EOO01_36115, partial [Chitinophagaceae bacterium]